MANTGTGTIAAAFAKPARMSITSLATAETLEVQYNPTEVEEEIGAVWQMLTVLGQSHQVPQYQYTANHALEFEIAFDALAQAGPVPYDIDNARRFLLSFCYGPRVATDIPTAAPSRALLVWPGWLELQCYFQPPLRFRHTRFSLAGPPTAFTAKLRPFEVRDARLFADDVRRIGTVRSPAEADGTGDSEA